MSLSIASKPSSTPDNRQPSLDAVVLSQSSSVRLYHHLQQKEKVNCRVVRIFRSTIQTFRHPIQSRWSLLGCWWKHRAFAMHSFQDPGVKLEESSDPSTSSLPEKALCRNAFCFLNEQRKDDFSAPANGWGAPSWDDRCHARPWLETKQRRGSKLFDCWSRGDAKYDVTQTMIENYRICNGFSFVSCVSNILCISIYFWEARGNILETHNFVCTQIVRTRIMCFWERSTIKV